MKPKRPSISWTVIGLSFGIIVVALLILLSRAHADTSVWLLRGWGPAIWSSGVDRIGAKARTIPGVKYVGVYGWTETQRVANEIRATPLTNRIVLGGYSCGVSSDTIIASAFNQVHRLINALIGIQMSTWCGGVPLNVNVLYAQETLNSHCLATLGFGCKKLQPGPNFPANRLVFIDRPQSHGAADDDPDTQRDVLDAIARVANSKFGAKPQVSGEVVRLLGQPL